MPGYGSRAGARSSSFGDALKGAIAGAVAVWVMDRVDWWMFNHEDPEARRRTERVRPGGLDPAHVLANRVADAIGFELAPRQPHPAGIATHYAIGVAPAALYGVLRQRLPELDMGRGALFGLGIFLLEDEILNPALGLAAHPRQYPWQAHARGLVAHLVYGFTTYAMIRMIDAPYDGSSKRHGGSREGRRSSRSTGPGASGYSPALRPEERGNPEQAS